LFKYVTNCKRRSLRNYATKEKFRKIKTKYEEKSFLFDEWIMGMTVAGCIITIIVGREIKHSVKRRFNRGEKK